jgi:hypothetical protein
MKNIHTILSEYGITVPDDKKTDFDKAIAANYKTVAEYDKQGGKLTAMTERAETAENTLKGFEGKDFDAITKDRDEWKQKHADLEKKHQEEADAREFNDLLTAAIGEAKGKNAKSIIANLPIDELKSSKNRDKDIKAAIAKVKEDCDYLFDADDGGGTPPAKFTGPRKDGGNGGGKMTREEIMAIPDRAARRDAIAKNQHLFQ